MRIKNKKQYYIKRKIIIEDNESNNYIEYDINPITIEANISPNIGKIQTEIYGERANYILKMLYDGPLNINEGDGICVYVNKTDTPDYKVISKKIYSHCVFELEKII